MTTRPGVRSAIVALAAAIIALTAFSPPVSATTPIPPVAEGGSVPTTVEAPADDEPTATTTAPDVEVPASTADPNSSVADESTDSTDAPMAIRPSAAPSVQDSDIPVGSILLALLVLTSVAAAAVFTSRRTSTNAAPRGPDCEAQHATTATRTSTSDVETLAFLVELGQALLDAGDAVSHIEATIRNIAEVNGIHGLGLLVLPSSLVLSLPHGDSVLTEVSTSMSNPLRLDQIDEVIHLVNDAERATISATEGRRTLSDIRASVSSSPTSLLLVDYVISTVGLAMILRGSWTEVAIAGVLGLVVGAIRLTTASQPPAYQVFWPLISAAAVSASVFAAARVFTDLAVFPALIAPLVSFLPGALLTTGVLELATGQIVSGASRLAAGAMRLTLLAIGIIAGAQLVGVPGGDIRSGSSGTLSALVPWVGVALFGVGIARFNGARRQSLIWILVTLYVAYAGQVIGGLFFGSALSAFFGAVAMTPVALFASRQRFGPTPLVTFLPGFWLLVPGALGLEGATRILGQGVTGSAGALATTVTSMIGISLGVLLGLILSGADPARPWSDSRRRPSPPR